MKIKKTAFFALILLCRSIAAQQKKYTLWYEKSAPYNGNI